MRGWSLGAREGKNQLLSTAEYRYTLLAPKAGRLLGFTGYLGVQLALFADAGLAWTARNELSLGRFIDGYGFGARFLVPFVDVVRVDFGFGEPGQGMTAHVAILPKAIMQRERVR